MKPPAGLAELVGKSVVVGGNHKLDGERLDEPGATGLVFDGAKIARAATAAVVDLFGDSDPETDSQDLLEDARYPKD